MFLKTAEAVTYQPLTDIGTVANNLAPGFFNSNTSGLGVLLNQIFFVVLAIAVVLAVFAIIRGGYLYMTSTDKAFQKEIAKRKIQAAFGGLILAFGTILILNTINTGIANFTLFFKPLPTPTQVQNTSQGGSSGGGTSSGNIQTVDGVTYFGGPGDVRISSDGYALQYCNNTYGGSVGDFHETTTVGNTTYRWCYALDSSGNRISFPNGSRSAHGGYFETGSVSGRRFADMSGDYVAYPLSGDAFGGLPNASNTGSANSQLRNMRVEITLENGQRILVPIEDRGPHSSRAGTLDVSPSLSNTISSGGGISGLRLIDQNGNTVTNDIR